MHQPINTDGQPPKIPSGHASISSSLKSPNVALADVAVQVAHHTGEIGPFGFEGVLPPKAQTAATVQTRTLWLSTAPRLCYLRPPSARCIGAATWRTRNSGRTAEIQRTVARHPRIRQACGSLQVRPICACRQNAGPVPPPLHRFVLPSLEYALPLHRAARHFDFAASELYCC